MRPLYFKWPGSPVTLGQKRPAPALPGWLPHSAKNQDFGESFYRGPVPIETKITQIKALINACFIVESTIFDEADSDLWDGSGTTTTDEGITTEAITTTEEPLTTQEITTQYNTTLAQITTDEITTNDDNNFVNTKSI